MDSLFSQNKAILELLKYSNELADIGGAIGVLSWDQETYMPPKGAEVKAMQLSTLSGLHHEKLTRAEVGRAIEAAKKEKGLNEYEKALVREMDRDFKKATKIPNELVREISEATSRAFESWRKAKTESNFSTFSPNLEKLLELEIKAAELLREGTMGIYDVMLDNHEPGLDEATVERVFSGLKKKLSELGIRLAKTTKGADKIIAGKKYPAQQQWDWGMKILKDMGYDLEAGRQDKSAHPFTINFGVNDVRITTWEDEGDVRPMLFATIHEGGHALYEQGVDGRLERTALAGGTGLAMHESQSRLWENMVGRSPEFWSYYYPSLKREFKGQLGKVDLKTFTKAVNVVKPSLIRVEADEVTYGLHIIVRFEIERDLARGKIKIGDLPEIWKEKYKELLGVVPETDREGVLQDVHWSHGSFGYFPTYLLGTLTAAQLWQKMKKELTVEQIVSQGKLMEIRKWLKENVHRYGKLLAGKELLVRVTGEELNPDYLIQYLEDKFDRIYG